MFEYFQSIRGVQDLGVRGTGTWAQLAEEEPDRRVIDFLGKVDTGVIGYRRSETELAQVRTVQRAFSVAFRKLGNAPVDSEPETDDKRITFELAHGGRDGTKVYLELDRESAGTRRLLVLLGLAFRALDEGLPLFIDELDASLHTHASEAVLKLFRSPKTNPKGAQLVATTHDTNLMNSSTLRRDQLWFTQKDARGATQLYPLTDIRTRKSDNLEKGYLQGRYGAVPFDDPLSSLGAPT